MSPLSISSLSYTLVKYSRSHPTSSPGQSNNGVSGIPQSWQHYTGPAIKLHLDTKKHLDGRLASVHLRVAWFLDSHTRQPDLIFEDVDLLEFSSLPSFSHSDVQSLPLKAIYRDNVVGMRYLHPTRMQLGSEPSYRRFQVIFQTHAEASELIGAIRDVCPCKASLLPQNQNQSQSQNQIRTQDMPPPRQLPRFDTILAPSSSQKVAYAHTSTEMAPPSQKRAPMDPGRHYGQSSDLQLLTFPSSSPQGAVGYGSNVSSHITSSDMTARPPPAQTSHHTGHAPVYYGSAPSPQTNQLDSNRSSDCPLPNSSFPPSSGKSSLNASLSATNATSSSASRADTRFLENLRDASSLYALPSNELDALVAHVIREDNFITLLETLDKLFKTKGPLM